MSARPTIIAANWKMNKVRTETHDFFRQLLRWFSSHAEALHAANVQLVVAPTFTSLQAAIEASAGAASEVNPAGIRVFAQNMHEADCGAFTGEVSAAMLEDLGVHGVILGHSERRQHYAESDRSLALKVLAAVEHGMSPMLCVGETGEQRESGDADDVVRRQVRVGLSKLPSDKCGSLAIAYEPVWAIGSGRSATPEIAQHMHGAIRSELASIFDDDTAAAVPVLYGGSVKPANAAELLAQPDIDGSLVGGAALDVESFSGIAQAAVTATAGASR